MIAAIAWTSITVLSFRRPEVGRRVAGVLFAVMGIVVNGAVLSAAPERYVALARAAPWAWYRDIGLAVVGPSPRGFGAGPTPAFGRRQMLTTSRR